MTNSNRRQHHRRQDFPLGEELVPGEIAAAWNEFVAGSGIAVAPPSMLELMRLAFFRGAFVAAHIVFSAPRGYGPEDTIPDAAFASKKQQIFDLKRELEDHRIECEARNEVLRQAANQEVGHE